VLRIVAVVLVVLLAALGISEATGVSRLTSTVIRLATGSGTLVIETDDPDVKISVDGAEVTIRGGGVAQVTVRPGQHKVAVLKDGKPVKEELVTITRNGREVVRMSLEPNVAATKSDGPQLSPTTGAAFSAPQDRLRTELVLNGHTGAIRGVAWSPNGERIVTGSADGTINVWDATTGRETFTIRGHQDTVTSVAWSPDGDRILSGSDDKTVRVWDAVTGEIILTLRGHADGVRSMAWSPSGDRILSGSADKTAKVWDAVTGQSSLTLTGHDGQIYSVGWSPDGGSILTGSPDKTARVWDATTGKEALILRHETRVFSVAWSPDGDRILCGADQTANVWDATTGETRLILETGNYRIWSVTWSPDGQRIVTGPDGMSPDKTLKVWDATTGQPTHDLQGNNRGVWSVAWRPDGERIVNGPDGGDAMVWDMGTRQGAVAFQRPANAPPPAVAPFDAEQAKQHQQAWANYLGAPVEIGNSIGMKLRLIPPGQFLMRPNYNVTITRPLRIGTCEVTIAQFRAFVDDTGYKTSAEDLRNGQQISQMTPRVTRDTNQRAEFTWRHKDVNRGDDYPVAQLSWEDAVKFCEWLSRKEGKRYRLPTEAEWEWACRAGSLNRFHFGDELGEMDDYAWCVDNSQNQAHPVGLKKPNPWGLFDVHGNVCEYCRDWHSTEFPSVPVSDPVGPPDGRARVTRGGGFISTPQALAFGFRGRFSPTWSLNHFGFRIVCDVDISGPNSDGVETADPDRQAAEWALAAGGIVQVNAGPDWISDVADLPKGPFRLTLIHFYDNEKVTDSGLAHFEHCKNLMSIKLHGENVNDAGMAHFRDCKELTSLILVFTQVGDAGLAHFQGCRRIEELIIPGSRVTDAGLAGFKDCQNLNLLDLSDTVVGDQGLAVFAECKSLEVLNLSRSQVSDAGLSHFQGCTKLSELRLIGAQITDAGLSHFQDSVNLVTLQAPQTKMSDKSVPLLANMTRLMKLDVRQTMITAAGVEALRQALPQCEIEWDGGVINPVAAPPPTEAASP
jgi:WD40 repeat protein/formylglycine-generating enzyme required for sulfatase activity